MNNLKIAELLFPNIELSIDEIFKKYPKRELGNNCQVTRYAPSPTGLMHIGNFFQAFISYNLAKNTNGIFYVRFEDTDSKREIKGSLWWLPFLWKKARMWKAVLIYATISRTNI